MLLTRIWGVLLAALATFCLGGMFLLSQGSGQDFSDADRVALRAVTEAGIVALDAQILSSPVRLAPSVQLDPELREALARTPEQEAKLSAEKIPLAQAFTEAAEGLRVGNDSDMTLAVVDTTGAIVAVSGVGEPLLTELIGSAPYQELTPDRDAMFSLTLGGQLQVVHVGRADERGRKLVGFEPLRIGAGSLVRRVLGTQNPAGIVRNKKLVGDIIGDQPVSAEIEKLAAEHDGDAPDEGASKVFTVGDGLDARIGAIGRVPGPAGKGKGGALIVVLSSHTAAGGQRDLGDAMGDAKDKGLMSRVNWVLLLGLLGVCAALAIYLPQIEALGPMRRLAGEFIAVSRGAQHQIFHDRYAGATGEVARAANAAHESLRAAYLAELEIDEEFAEESTGAGGGRSQRPKTMRGRKLTRSVRKVDDSAGPSDAPTPAEPVAEPAPAPVRSAPAARVPFGDRTQPAPAPPRNTEPTPAASTVRRPTPIAEPASAPPPGSFAPPKPSIAPPPTARPPLGVKPVPAPAPIPPPRPAAAPVAPIAPLESLGEDEDDARMRYYREIFEEFLQVKIACGEPTDGFTFDKFSKKLQKNTQDILEKHADVREVQFTVYVKDGKAALKAKIVRGSTAS